MNQAVIPGLEVEPASKAALAENAAPDPDDFDWLRDEAVIVEQQRSIAVYRNPRNHVVIRTEGDGYGSDGDDKCIILSTPDALKLLIAGLQRELKNWG